jgi:putative ABC transport system substrate-binding protein
LGAIVAMIATSVVHGQRRRSRRIGLLWLGSPETGNLREALVGGLRAQGLVEGSAYDFEDRGLVSRYELLDEAALRLVDRKPDVIVTYGATATKAVRKATATLPIVMVTGGDPVQMGLVAALSRPGGNITGITMRGDELSSKRLELLRETVPSITKVAVMFNPASQAELGSLQSAQEGARSIAVQSHAAEVRTPDDFEAAFRQMTQANADSLLVVGSTMFFAHRDRIAALARQHKLPAVANTREYAEAGTLLAYGPDVAYTFRQASVHVAKILKGESPATLPFEQSSKLLMVVNLDTARHFNIAVPQSVLLRADEVLG